MAVPDEAVFDPEALERLRETLRQVPAEQDGLPSTRWTLARLLVVLDWLGPRSPSGLSRLLHRHGIRLRMGRPRLFSPDPAYAEKERRLYTTLGAVTTELDCVVLFLDMMAYHHWPEPGRTWSSLDDPAPRAERAAPGERHKKVMGALNARTGQVTQYHRARMTADQVAEFLVLLRETYPDAARIAAILDNAPVHHSEPVMQMAAGLEIELVYLPSYAPWLNPIEKLWGWVRQDVIRLHRQAGHWDQVPAMLTTFLDHFGPDGEDRYRDQLLRRVGLRGEGTLAQACQGRAP
jgi:transposase